MTESSSITINITSIYKAWEAFRKGKKLSYAIMCYEEDLENNLLDLLEDIRSESYAHGIYSHKISNEKKRRDIYVANVRDRVVHRLVYDYLVPLLDPKFDFDLWSCRKEKGLHACLARTQQLLVRHQHAWIWRCDIHKFFDSVPHRRLMNVVRKEILCARTNKILDTIISSYKSSSYKDQYVGLPIGNLTSQLLANMYLDQLDKYVRHEIRPLAYMRYGDDFLVFCKRKTDVQQAQLMVIRKLAELGLSINARQNIILQSFRGLHFLGHVITASELKACRKTHLLMLQQLNLRNIGSYSAMNIDEDTRRLIPWRVDI